MLQNIFRKKKLSYEDPSRNRLISTAYFAKPGFSVLYAWVCIHYNIFFFFKIGQIYMQDAESAESKEKSNLSFSNFYFSSYREKFIENLGDDVTKMTKK